MSEWSMPGTDEWAAPGYTPERLLGRGVSGRVVAAVSDATGERVAIKYFDDSVVINDPAFLRAYRSEAERLKALESAHIARVVDYVEEPGQGAAVVMAFVDGVSLRELINHGGPLKAEAALVIVKDCLLGLAAAHSLPVSHGDVKPENVLIDAEGSSTLTDLGIAVKAGKRIPAGTPAYMAPELWGRAPSAPTTDIYAATAVLWESLSGRPPFSGGPRQLRRQHASAPLPVEQFDQPLQSLLTSGMAKNPADRPHTARSFIHDIEARATDAYGADWEEKGRSDLVQSVAAAQPQPGGNGRNSATVTRLVRRRRRNAVVVAATAVLAFVALAALALSAMSGKAQPVDLSAAVTAAQVIVTPPVAASACATPTTFTYSGTVTATEPGNLSYRWLYSSGRQGPVQTMSFTAAGNRTVSGGAVTVSKAGEGWAEIKVLGTIAKASNKATYQLLCTTVSSGVTLSATVRPKTQTVYSCAAPPPTLTATGSIRTKKAETIRYYWALADGQRSAPRTVTFTAPGAKALPPLKIKPSALPASGEAVLVVTKPVAAASRPAPYKVSCQAPITVTTTPVLPTAGTVPTPGGGSSAKSSPTPGKTTAKATHTASSAPATGSSTSATSPSTASSSAAPTSSGPTSAAPSSSAPTTPVQSPTTPVPSGS